MSSLNLDSDGTSQNTEVKKVLTPEEIAVLRAKVAALPSPEEMRQKLDQLSDCFKHITEICESLLNTKRS